MIRIVLAAAASFIIAVTATSAISRSTGNSSLAAASVGASFDAASGRFVSVGWFARKVVMR
jgi:hypothetical protein